MEHETSSHTATGTAEHELFYQEPVFWVAIAFCIFMALALRPLCRAVAKALDARSADIASELKEARRLREEAQEVLASYQKKQREALQEAESILASTRADTVRLMEKAEQDLKLSLDKRMALANARIAQAEANAMAQVQAYVAEIALEAAGKIVADHMKEGGSDALIARAVADIGKKLH